MNVKDLSTGSVNKISSILKKYGFSVKKTKHQITFVKDYRTFYLNSTDINDPYFLTTDIDLERFLLKNYFLKSKHSKSYQDKRFNEQMDLDEVAEQLNWVVVDAFGIKDFDSNPTMEEPLAESMFQVLIKNSPHIILDDNIYEGETQAILSLIKPLAKDALISLTYDNIIIDIIAIKK